MTSIADASATASEGSFPAASACEAAGKGMLCTSIKAKLLKSTLSSEMVCAAVNCETKLFLLMKLGRGQGNSAAPPSMVRAALFSFIEEKFSSTISMIACELVPLKPNELTPPIDALWGRDSFPCGKRSDVVESVTNGLTLRRPAIGGAVFVPSTASSLTRPKAPAAASPWPKLAFVAPRHSGTLELNTALRPSNSIGSPRGVPVP